MKQSTKYFKYKAQVKKAYSELEKAYRDVKDSYVEMIFRFALVAEYKDEATGTHLVRIADYCTEIAHAMKLPEKEADLIRYASPMHDIGKLVIPDEILKKPAGLTPEEREIMKKHTVLGANIFQGSRSPILKVAKEICLTHHERYDGTGYPKGLKGKDIPISGRIAALADVFDALISVRPYKQAYKFEEAVEMVKDESGSHFDPKVVKAFLRRKDKIKKIWRAAKDIEHFVGSKHL